MNEWMNEFVFAPLIETYREGAVCPSYAFLYSSDLSLQQKPVNVRLMSWTVSGNEFQIEGPEVAKLRDPYRTNRLRGIVRSWRAAEQRCWRPVVDDTGVHMSARYDGAMRRRHLNTIVPSLYWMRCHTGSQWRSWHMVSVMWLYLRFPTMSRAAPFNTDWSGRKWAAHAP